MASQDYGAPEYAPSDEFREFFEDFGTLMNRYPAAVQRFALIDFKDKPERSLSADGWDCFPFGDWTICEWSPPVE